MLLCAKQTATFSTSVGLAMEEEMTPERMPHITLVSSVSSEREEWAAHSNCEQAAFDTMQQAVGSDLFFSGIGHI